MQFGMLAPEVGPAREEALLREQYLVYDDDAAVTQSARQARTDLLRLFDADEDRSAAAQPPAAPEPPPPGGAG